MIIDRFEFSIAPGLELGMPSGFQEKRRLLFRIQHDCLQQGIELFLLTGSDCGIEFSRSTDVESALVAAPHHAHIVRCHNIEMTGASTDGIVRTVLVNRNATGAVLHTSRLEVERFPRALDAT